MPRRTNPFQQLTTSIMTVFYEPEYSVIESVLECNPRTGIPREIDILITERKNPQNKMMIECRDHTRPQDVLWIDQLTGKSQSLGFSKVIAVSSSGFTISATKEAEDRGIELLSLKKAEERDWRKWLFQIKEITISKVSIELRDVAFGVDAEWTGEIRGEPKLFNVVLVDKKNTERIPLRQWISNLENNPEQQSYMDATSKHGKINPVVYTHKCSSDWGFELENDNTFVPLVELKVYFVYTVDETIIPLDHMTIGDERLLVGDIVKNNHVTKITIHESKDKIITVLLENKTNNER